MMTKEKKSSMSMLRKVSIVPVALVAFYLFACTSNDIIMMELPDNATKNELVFMFHEVEEKPLFDGLPADEEFRVFVQSVIVYPKEAFEKGITGRVFVEFEIDTDGSLTNVRLLRGADPLLDEEALRVINISPKWTPGKHGGVPVKVKYQFPFVFQIMSDIEEYNVEETP